MSITNIRLSTIKDVQEFVKTVNMFDIDIDLSSGRYIVDAKSIMGIFSLDLLQPIKLTANTDDSTELFRALDAFIIK